ncbi:hypothetical protein JCM19240_5648 [Vibrio maritimus]|uniref:Uncharacterized protein n=1 Tax=Vibrio maritimus TaxID=990268 RepID=A0A090TLN2_9VIBR|nr:hypothetical protein JCM19240_5648 [Vibrio maritimus]
MFCVMPFMVSAQGVYVSGGIQSAYISEGRNAFDSAVATAEIGSYLDGFVFNLWGARALDNKSWETNASIGYEFTFDTGVDWFIGYNRFDQNVRGEGDDANEILNSLSLVINPDWSFIADHTYRLNDNAQYLQLTAKGSFELTKIWELNPYITQELDFGYAKENFNGLNNVRFGAILSRTFGDKWDVSAEVHRSIAQEGVKRDGKGNQTCRCNRDI